MDKKPSRLGEILVRKGWITWEQLEEALKLQNESENAAPAKSAERVDMLSVAKKPKPSQVLNLGEILIRNGWITWEQLDDALKTQKLTGDILGKILLSKGYVSDKDFQRALAIHFGMSFVDFDKIKILPEVTQFVPKAIAYEHHIFPLVKKTPTLLVAISNPNNLDCYSALSKIAPDYEILTALATTADIEKALRTHYGPP